MAADAAAAGSGRMHVVVDGLHGDTNQTKPLAYFWNLRSKSLRSIPYPILKNYTTRSLGAHITCTHMHAVKCVLNCFTNCLDTESDCMFIGII